MGSNPPPSKIIDLADEQRRAMKNKLDPVIEELSIHSKAFKKKSKQLIELNDLYLKFLYLHTFDDVEVEKKRLRKIFNTK